jgi:hypothetical protein
VLTAVGGNVHNAWAGACANLPSPLDDCTPFSGHLLNVLGQGMPDHPDDLTLGALRAGIDEGMQECGVHHTPRMLLNDASEAAPLFTNHAKGRRPRTRALDTVDEWVRELLLNGDRNLPDLMRRPDHAGRVVVRLKAGDQQSRDLARHLDRRAGELLPDPVDFVRYWGEIEPAIRTDDTAGGETHQVQGGQPTPLVRALHVLRRARPCRAPAAHPPQLVSPFPGVQVDPRYPRGRGRKHWTRRDPAGPKARAERLPGVCRRTGGRPVSTSGRCRASPEPRRVHGPEANALPKREAYDGG